MGRERKGAKAESGSKSSGFGGLGLEGIVGKLAVDGGSELEPEPVLGEGKTGMMSGERAGPGGMMMEEGATEMEMEEEEEEEARAGANTISHSASSMPDTRIPFPLVAIDFWNIYFYLIIELCNICNVCSHFAGRKRDSFIQVGNGKLLSCEEYLWY